MKTPITENGGSNRNIEANSNWDWFYGGGEAYWPDLASALAKIPTGKRAAQTFAVNDGGIKEYWWPNPAALADGNVAIKGSSGVTDANTSTGVGALALWTGTQAEYNAIVTKSNGTLYFMPGAIYKGTVNIYKELPPDADNLFFSSQNFIDVTNWTMTGATLTPNAAIAPDGTNTATRVTEGSIMDWYSLFQYNGFEMGKIFTYSLHAKKAERHLLHLEVRNHKIGAVFNLDTGTFSNVSSGVTPWIVDAGNGWYRCAITYTQIQVEDNVDAYMQKVALESDYVGDGVSGMYYWGAQLTNTSELTAYKPTDAGEPLSPLAGLTVNFLGDSITYASGVTNSFVKELVDKAGIIATNYGIPNSGIAVRGDRPTEEAMCNRYATMTNNADIVIVFAGINDFDWSVPLGAINDDPQLDTTFYGAMHILAKGLIAKYPTKRIGFMTPINTVETGVEDYTNAMVEVCAKYAIPVLNLTTEGGITNSIPAQMTALIPDGTHPNDAGHQVIFRKLYHFLTSL